MQQAQTQRRVMTEQTTVARVRQLLGGAIIVIVRERRQRRLRVYTEPLRWAQERRIERELVLADAIQHVSTSTRRGRIITITTLDS